MFHMCGYAWLRRSAAPKTARDPQGHATIREGAVSRHLPETVEKSRPTELATWRRRNVVLSGPWGQRHIRPDLGSRARYHAHYSERCRWSADVEGPLLGGLTKKALELRRITSPFAEGGLAHYYFRYYRYRYCYVDNVSVIVYRLVIITCYSLLGATSEQNILIYQLLIINA